MLKLSFVVPSLVARPESGLLILTSTEMSVFRMGKEQDCGRTVVPSSTQAPPRGRWAAETSTSEKKTTGQTTARSLARMRFHAPVLSRALASLSLAITPRLIRVPEGHRPPCENATLLGGACRIWPWTILYTCKATQMGREKQKPASRGPCFGIGSQLFARLPRGCGCGTLPPSAPALTVRTPR